MRNDRLWRGLYVDGALKTSWLERMNGITGVRIYGSCAGHKGLRPALWYSAPEGVRSLLLALAELSRIARVEFFFNGQPWLIGLKKPPHGGGFRTLTKAQWWRRILWWLERWYGKKDSPKKSLRAISSRSWPGGIRDLLPRRRNGAAARRTSLKRSV